MLSPPRPKEGIREAEEPSNRRASAWVNEVTLVIQKSEVPEKSGPSYPICIYAYTCIYIYTYILTQIYTQKYIRDMTMVADGVQLRLLLDVSMGF